MNALQRWGFEVKAAQRIKAFGQGLGLSSMRECARYSGGSVAESLGVGVVDYYRVGNEQL